MAIFNLATFFNKYKYHFLFWGVFITYEITLAWMSTHILHSYKEYVIAYLISLTLFYFHAKVLLKYTLGTDNKLLKYSLPLLITLEFLCYSIIKIFIERHLYKHIDPEPVILGLSLISYYKILWRFIYFIGTSTGYYFLMQNQRQRQQIERMKQEELKKILQEKELKNELTLIQNAILRTQINPHFLINSLSYLYNETWKIEPETAENILSLTEIMQYALNKEVSSKDAKLEDEIKLIENFLSLYQVKQTYKVHINLVYSNEVLSVPFIPLIMMALTEIIIKNGKLDDPLKPAEIKIFYEYSTLYIQTTNFKAIEKQITSNETKLKNISNRLLLAYGEKATFNYHIDPHNYFHTDMKIQF